MPGLRTNGPAGVYTFGYSDNFFWSPSTLALFAQYITQGGKEDNFGEWLQACYDLENGRAVRVGKKRITRLDSFSSENSGDGDSSGTTDGASNGD